MIRRLSRAPWAVLALGLVVGIAIGAGIAGKLSGPRIQLPETLLNASATHGGETMAMATGPIADDVEGLFILDFITGELTCKVINPRTGFLGGAYSANVVKDLGIEQGKQPKYLMVTGAANFRTQGGNVRPAQSVVYVADSNTGHWVAYWLPWNRAAAQYNFAQASQMLVMGKGSARNIQVE